MTCGPRLADYGSEGWGFESLRARNIIGRVACENAGRAPFKIRPLWTCGAPTVLVSFGPRPSGLRCLIRLGLLASWSLAPIFASRVRPQHTAVDEHLDQPAQPCVATTPGLPSCMVRPVRLGAVSLTTASRSQEAQQLAYHDPLHGNAHRVNVTRTTSFDDHSGVVIDIVGGPCVAGGGTCDSGPIRCAKIGVSLDSREAV